MACYRSGGCGPYEMRSCSECPASKPEYMRKQIENGVATPPTKATKQTKIKVFLNEKGVRCAMVDDDINIELEIIDESTKTENDIDAYINQLCGDGFIFIDEDSIKIDDSL